MQNCGNVRREEVHGNVLQSLYSFADATVVHGDGHVRDGHVKWRAMHKMIQSGFINSGIGLDAI